MAVHTVCGLGESNDTVCGQRIMELNQLPSDSRDPGMMDIYTHPIRLSISLPLCCPSTFDICPQAHVAAVHGALAAAMVALARRCSLEHCSSVSGSGGLIVSPNFGCYFCVFTPFVLGRRSGSRDATSPPLFWDAQTVLNSPHSMSRLKYWRIN